MTKVFLTIDEAKQQGLEHEVFQKGVYWYGKDGKYTLIQFGVILVSDVEYFEWHEKDTYLYRTCSLADEHTTVTLVEDGVEVLSGVDDVDYYEKGWYTYEEDGTMALVEDGVEVLSGFTCIYIYGKGNYLYGSGTATCLVNNNEDDE